MNGITDLDELALLGGGAGADDAVAEGEPGRGHLKRALTSVRRRRGEEGEEAGEHTGGQHGGRGLAPAEDEAPDAGGLRGRGARVPRGAGLREAEEEAGQRRRGRGRRGHGCLLARSLPLLQQRLQKG